MKIIKALFAVCCSVLCAASFAGCTGKSTLLGEPAECERLYGQPLFSESFTDYKKSVEKFADKFVAAAFTESDGNKNFAVSPISVYSALSLAAECAEGQTLEKLVSALGATKAQIKENFPLLRRSLVFERKSLGRVAGKLSLANSVWVDKNLPVNKSCIDALSGEYFAHIYSADFLNSNSGANRAVRKYVKKQTEGLIDTDFGLKEDTVFTLINALYLKTLWNDDGNALPYYPERQNFTCSNGEVKQAELLQGFYCLGDAYSDEAFTSFYTRTYDGYKLKFMLPNDGYGIKDVFTESNIAVANSAEYKEVDDEKREIYYTRCIFPEFKCAFDGEISGLLKEKFGLGVIFDSEKCDFSALTESRSFCGDIRHVTDLKVDKKGIEGASVTVIRGAGAAGPPEYTIVHRDLIMNKAFGFIITDSNDVTLFSGAVNVI